MRDHGISEAAWERADIWYDGRCDRMAEKTKWQLKHEENGYEVVRVRGGQVRRYGPSIYEYIVRDLSGERDIDEVRAYCTTEVRCADDPRKHGLHMHLKSFNRLDDGSYCYICGHEYTG